MTTLATLLVMALTTLQSAMLTLAGSEPAEPEAPIRTADDLLLALEREGEGIRTLRAGIRYQREFAVAGDIQTRTGTLYYRSRPSDEGGPDSRAFAVNFDTMQVGGVLHRDREMVYIFDGSWVVEKHPRERQFIKRRVVPEGQAFDPLRLGEGPFPIPIGQKRDDIVERFEATLVPVEEGLWDDELVDFASRSTTFQLRLVPRPAYSRELELTEVRIWYEQSSEGPLRLLPRMAWTKTADEDESIVQLINVRFNEPLPEGVIDTEPPGAGWDVDIRDDFAERRR
ncbi:MAG: hypothetical protein JJU33_07855 [Phycisphaerales bacterium]|nr:hypothetical protein [Phycisphaerales bacterium]